MLFFSTKYQSHQSPPGKLVISRAKICLKVNIMETIKSHNTIISTAFYYSLYKLKCRQMWPSCFEEFGAIDDEICVYIT